MVDFIMNLFADKEEVKHLLPEQKVLPIEPKAAKPIKKDTSGAKADYESELGQFSEWLDQAESGNDPCKEPLACGHRCFGSQGSQRCLPCLEPDCASAQGFKTDLCSICFTSGLEEEPCVQLNCGHIFHANCVQLLMMHRWSSLKISFAFLSCPGCKTPIETIDCAHLQHDLIKALTMKTLVEKEALKVAERQGLLEDERLKNPDDHFYGKPLDYAMHRCAFYECFPCKKPFFGGLIDCEQELAQQEREKTSAEDLRCQQCLMSELGAGEQTCETHGTENIVWKC